MKRRSIFLAARYLAVSLALFTVSAATAQAATVLHYWDFEADYTDKADGADGTAGSEVTTGVGHEGNTAAVFPNVVSGGGAFDSTGYVDINGASVTGAFSMSYWFNITEDNLANNRGIFDFSGNGGDGAQSLYIGSSDTLAFRVDGDGGSGGAALAAGELEDGQWHFVAATYDPVLGIELHLDGFGVDATGGAFGNSTFDVDQYLGAFNVNGSVAARGLGGSLDDVAIYSGVLSETEISGLFSGNISPLDVVVPESSTLLLLVLGFAGLSVRRGRCV